MRATCRHLSRDGEKIEAQDRSNEKPNSNQLNATCPLAKLGSSQQSNKNTLSLP
jgi:hypothetical protein